MKPTVIAVNNLADAKNELEKINAHPIGVQIMALKAVFRLIKFENVDAKTANIIKQEMLSRGGEAAVSQTVGEFKDQKTNLIIMVHWRSIYG